MRQLLIAILCAVLPYGLLGQDELLIDSLEAEVVRLQDQDSLRLRTLSRLWHHTLYTDLPRSETYARRILREAQTPELLALGHRLMGITADYQGAHDSAAYYYHQGIALYRTLENKAQEGTLLFNLANLHNVAGLSDTALYYLRLADSAFITVPYKEPQVAINHLSAVIEREQGRFSRSLEHAIRSFELARGITDSSRMGDAAHQIALNYDELGEDSLAVVYLQRAATIYHAAEDYYYEAELLSNLAMFYVDAGRYDEARTSLDRALRLIEEKSVEEVEMITRHAYGYYFREQEQPEAAEKQYLTGLLLADKKTHAANRLDLLVALAETQRKLGKRTPALRHAREALEMAVAQKRTTQEQQILVTLTELAKAAGRKDETIAYLERRQVLQDSLYRDELGKELAELQVRFERAEQDRLITEQRARLALLGERAKVDRLQKIGLGLGVLLLFALTTILYFYFRARQVKARTRQARLDQQIRTQQQELSTHALQMAQKGRLLDELSGQLREVRGERPGDRKKLDQLLREIGSEERIDQDWDNFRTYFQGVHGDYLDRLRQQAVAKLSSRDERLSALIRMRLSNPEIATILGISMETLYKAKYRLRKKLQPFEESVTIDAHLQDL